jgi:hypothetical protein
VSLRGLLAHLGAPGARRGVRGAPPARPSRLVVGITTSTGSFPCWGCGLGVSNRTIPSNHLFNWILNPPKGDRAVERVPFFTNHEPAFGTKLQAGTRGSLPNFLGCSLDPFPFASAIKCHQKGTCNSAGSPVGSLAHPRATPRLGGAAVSCQYTSFTPLCCSPHARMASDEEHPRWAYFGHQGGVPSRYVRYLASYAVPEDHNALPVPPT